MALAAACLLLALALLAPTAGARRAPAIVFPVVAKLTFFGDDYGQPRGNGPHEGNDIGAPFGSPVVAVLDGVVELLPGYGGGGFAIRLVSDAGDHFLYLHLGNNRSRAKAYAPGLESGQRVRQGQVIGFVGYSGNASASAPHLHFEYHPGGGPHVDPYAMLQAAGKLAVAPELKGTAKATAGADGTPISLSARGRVSWVASGDGEVRLRLVVRSARLSTGKAAELGKAFVFSLPLTAAIERNGRVQTTRALAPGQAVTVWSTAIQAGVMLAPGAVTLAKVRIDRNSRG
jgi:Peptidase family M23